MNINAEIDAFLAVVREYNSLSPETLKHIMSRPTSVRARLIEVRNDCATFGILRVEARIKRYRNEIPA